jgi:hypothetical protein
MTIIAPQRMRPLFTMRKALADPTLFANAMKGPTWGIWRIILIAAMGESLTHAERAAFKRFTGRDREPGERVDELVAIVGRRGGKSRAASVLAAYIAGVCQFTGWRSARGPESCV